jgi:hypothetical protein
MNELNKMQWFGMEREKKEKKKSKFLCCILTKNYLFLKLKCQLCQTCNNNGLGIELYALILHAVKTFQSSDQYLMTQIWR